MKDWDANTYIPTILGPRGVKLCREHGWTPEPIKTSKTLKCTGKCARYVVIDDGEREFFTCGPCKKGMRNAKRNGKRWQVKAVVPHHIVCLGGCGREVFGCKTDKCAFFVCRVCRDSMREFMRKKNGQAKKIERGKGWGRRYHTTKAQR